MDNQIVITKEQSITTNSSDTSFALTKQQMFEDIRLELSKQWMHSKYIIDKLKLIIDNAYIINNNWDQMPDFKVMLKWIELLLKLSWLDVWNKIQIAIFNNVPKPWDKLEY